MKQRSNFLKVAIGAGFVIVGFGAGVASAAPFLSIDYESANGPFPAEGDTETGFQPFTQHNAAGRTYTTSEGNIFVNVAGEQPAGDDGYFDRGPIPDNPPFTFGDLYRDFAFNNNEKEMVFTFSGLQPGTAYSVTWFSYDNGGTHSVTFSGINGTTGTAGPLNYIGGDVPTENYDPDNSITAVFTSDASGGLTVKANDTGPLRVNGVQIARVQAEVPFQITQLSANPATGDGTLTFTSLPGATYAIFGTPNLIDWFEIETNIPSGGQNTTEGFTDPGLTGATRRFYRVEKLP